MIKEYDDVIKEINDTLNNNINANFNQDMQLLAEFLRLKSVANEILSQRKKLILIIIHFF